MSENNLFSYPNLPKDATPLFKSEKSWTVYLLVIPIFIIAYIGIRLRLPYVTGVQFTRGALFVGVALSLPFLAVHEFIHAICCPKGSTVFTYITPVGIALIPTCPLSKHRYIIVVTMPAIILGVCPFLIWLCLPELSSTMSSILFAFSLCSMGACVGDIYNAILAAMKMSSKSVLVTSGKECFFFNLQEK